ncbi:MAG: excisionase family DNA-binding protein [Elusimicrobiota bacterium]
MMSNKESGLWTWKEVAEFLKVTKRWIDEARKKKGLGFKRFGWRTIRYDPEEVKKWAEKFGNNQTS